MYAVVLLVKKSERFLCIESGITVGTTTMIMYYTLWSPVLILESKCLTKEKGDKQPLKGNRGNGGTGWGLGADAPKLWVLLWGLQGRAVRGCVRRPLRVTGI